MESEYIGLLGVIVGALISGAITFFTAKLNFKHEAKVREENRRVEYYKNQLSQFEWLIAEVSGIRLNVNKVIAGIDLLSQGIIEFSKYQIIKEDIDFFEFLDKVNEIEQVIFLHCPQIKTTFTTYVEDATALVGFLNGFTPPMNNEFKEKKVC